MNNNIRFPKRLSKYILLFHTKDANIRILLTAVYGSLIPLIMGGNLLLILGRIKTTKKKFTSSQILFSTLFVSDLKSNEPTCFEVQLSAFSMSFPTCISFNLLCIISIERYVYVVYNGFYTRIVTKKGGPYLYSPVFKALFLIESQCYPYISLSHTCF